VWLLPQGRRRVALAAAIEGMFKAEFRERVLAFTSEVAVVWARIVVDRTAMGRPISHVDAQIAAIARSVGAQLATRNVRDFEDCGVDIVNPWAG
jgi:predicted nucleic acid-binding protein